MYVKFFVLNFISSTTFILLGRRIFLRFIPTKTNFILGKDNKKVVKLGGIILFLALTFAGLFFRHNFLYSNTAAFIIYLSASLMLILGLLDDFIELRVWQKFLGELIITIFFILTSRMTTEIIFFPKILNFIITLIWILGITNAFNLLDILDGLATGVSFIISLAFLYLASITGNALVGIFSYLLSSSLLAVLIFNFPPAKIYLGDSGSLFLGFIFSILSISTSYARPAHELALLSPIFILGFPIFDTIFVSLIRISKHKPVFVKTDDHFALRLIASGKKKNAALFICYFMALIFITLGIIFTKLTNVYSLILILATVVFISTIFFKISKLR